MHVCERTEGRRSVFSHMKYANGKLKPISMSPTRVRNGLAV